jgi:cytochrome c-type biogenesis protein CcmH/NrfF
VLHRARWRQFILTCTFALAVAPAWAQGPSHDAAAIARTLMSPYCPGLLLADCQSSGAHDLRSEIRSRLEAGETSRDIVDDLATRFGDRIRTQPAMEGLGAVAWILPPMMGIASVSLLALRLRTIARRARNPEQCRSMNSEDDRMLARVEQELLSLD